MTDVTQGRDQDGAELSAAEEQLPGGPKTRFSQPDQPTPPKRWSASDELQLQLLAPGACFSDQRLCDLSGVIGEDRDLHHMTFVDWKFSGESRVEVWVLERDQPPARPVKQTEHVEVLVLVTTDVHR